MLENDFDRIAKEEWQNGEAMQVWHLEGYALQPAGRLTLCKPCHEEEQHNTSMSGNFRTWLGVNRTLMCLPNDWRAEEGTSSPNGFPLFSEDLLDPYLHLGYVCRAWYEARHLIHNGNG